MIKELTCIGCPMGCQITVDILENGAINVTGNTCKRGEDYAKKEVTSPTRIVTSTIKVIGGDIKMVSVKTANDIPKGKIFEIMKCIKNKTVEAPVNVGDILIKNIADTGVDIIATKNVECK